MIDPQDYGGVALALVEEVFSGPSPVSRAALLVRHSAREYNRDVHDMENPLTDPGRDFCRRLGRALPKTLCLRGYHSPAGRCAETAELILDTHTAHGGKATRARAVEALGVFYALDQRKMWKALQAGDGLKDFVHAWGQGTVAADAMIPAAQTAQLLLRSTLHRLRAATDAPQLDLCVSHDLTLYLLKDQLLGQNPREVETEYLDALVLYEADERVWLKSRHGPAQDVSAQL